ALFLFIVSIASADSIRRLFGPGTTIAKVGGQKIDYEDYRQRIEEANQQQQQQMDRDELSQRAIQSLIFAKLVNEQIDQLGINVTDAEISRAMTGQMPHPAAQQFIQAASRYLQLPVANGNTLLDAINNPARYNLTPEQLNYVAQQAFGTYTMADAWAKQENAVEQSIQQQAVSSLITGLFTANVLDAKTMHADNSTVSTLSYVTAPLSSVPDKDIEVTDADLKAKWNEMKPMFKLAEETREIDYIIVPIGPSADDYNAAEVEVDRLVEALRAQPGVEGAVVSSKFVHDSKTLPLSEVSKDADLRLVADSLMKKEGVFKYRRSGQVFRVAKILDITSQIDSINVSLYYADSSAKADSVLNELNGGKSFKELATANPQQAADSVWQSLVGAPEDLTSLLANAAVGQAFVYNDSVRNSHAVFKVNKRNAPRQYVDAVVYKYTVDPSATTISDIKTQLSGFLASNSKGDAFSANADSLYTLRHATVTGSTPRLGYTPNAYGQSGYADTRHAIKWAMNAKKGEVSPIFEDNRDFYVVAAVKDIYADDYIPYTAAQAKEGLETMVKADKKAGKLIEQYKGKAKDIAGYAQLMGGEVLTDSTVVFTAQRLASLMANEYALQAQVAAAAKGALVGPVQGTNEVMVFVVDDSQVTGRPYDFRQDGSAFVNAFGIKDFYGLLVGDRKIKNNSLQFENYDK
ncbi:MAG: SurA N-terminal domain-containing protein, partial [Muribaculaceae bacterium]|nr:SurA N-terminal domain-containing protein [Muribaculaceae bacterium]